MHNLALSPTALTALFDAVPAGVLLAAPDGRILYVNIALCRLFGYRS
jgi:PAS domain S-box-containing protein